MVRYLFIAFLLGAALCAPAMTTDGQDEQAREAQAFFQRFAEMGERFDPALADVYSDTARITNIRHRANGTTRSMTMPAVAYKALIKSAMPAAKARNDVSTFSDIGAVKENGNVRITATRYSKLKDYSSSYTAVLSKDPNGQWVITDEISHSRP